MPVLDDALGFAVLDARVQEAHAELGASGAPKRHLEAGSAEALHQHQVLRGGTHAGVDDRAAVRRDREGQVHVAECTSHCRGFAGREVEVLKASLTRGLELDGEQPDDRAYSSCCKTTALMTRAPTRIEASSAT